MFEIGDSVRLLIPYKGYSAGTLIGFDFPYWIIELSNGLEIRCYEDEFEEA